MIQQVIFPLNEIPSNYSKIAFFIIILMILIICAMNVTKNKDFNR